MTVFVHPQGICESGQVGDGTRIWAFAHVLEGARIGRDCNICDHVFIENDVIIGDRATIKSGVQLWDGVRIGDGVFIGPNATFTNDKYPRSKVHGAVLITSVLAGASIGANATLLPGIVIGAHAMVGAGSVVTADVPPGAVVMGNPARIGGYVDTIEHDGRGRRREDADALPAVSETAVRGATVYRLNLVTDLRGKLAVAQYGSELPFMPRRCFVVYDVPGKHVRGAHAHRECEQFLMCVKGSLAVVVDDGIRREEIHLDRPDTGVYVPPLVWAGQYKYSADAVLLVLASHDYDSADYIRDYAEYQAIVSEQRH
jgi:UDP-2-acetamido-3-amino-2,3-dideoxy-glucuronate N-acetyltransferase